MADEETQQAGSEDQTRWPHAPTHRLTEAGVYFVTAATLRKEHFLRSRKRLRFLHQKLLALADEYGWRLEAWAVFSNHYHFVAHSPEDEAGAASLSTFLSHLHTKAATFVNQLDGAEGRRVWYQFRNTG